jgi:type I restriction enzyme S subunit
LLGALNLNQYASGAAQPGLNVSTLVDIELIFVPLKLQNQFAEKLELIDNQKSKMKGNLIKNNQLFNSLIQKAFNGELVS